MITQPKTPKQFKEKFLDNNPKFKEINDSNPSNGEFFTINEDDEVWIMQCPKGTDVSILKEQKLKLPGRSNQNEHETIAIEYPQPVPHAFGHRNRKGHNSIKIVPIQGSILLRNRLKTVASSEDPQHETPSGRVPMPVGIKERHPLHGVDYKSKLEINPEIAERLKHAHEISIRSKPKKKSKSKNKTITVDSDSDVELVTKKKSKKKKGKRSHSNDEDSVVSDGSKNKKKKKNSLSDDIAEDLQWIQKL